MPFKINLEIEAEFDKEDMVSFAQAEVNRLASSLKVAEGNYDLVFLKSFSHLELLSEEIVNLLLGEDIRFQNSKLYEFLGRMFIESNIREIFEVMKGFNKFRNSFAHDLEYLPSTDKNFDAFVKNHIKNEPKLLGMDEGKIENLIRLSGRISKELLFLKYGLSKDSNFISFVPSETK